jgi:hypothetical protein
MRMIYPSLQQPGRSLAQDQKSAEAPAVGGSLVDRQSQASDQMQRLHRCKGPLSSFPSVGLGGPPVGDGLGGVAQRGVAGGQRQPRPQLLVRQHPQHRLRQPQHVLQAEWTPQREAQRRRGMGCGDVFGLAWVSCQTWQDTAGSCRACRCVKLHQLLCTTWKQVVSVSSTHERCTSYPEHK